MKKIASLLLAAALIAGTLCGCGESAGAGSASAAREPVIIRFPTASASGALYAVGAAITNLWDTQIDGVRASSQASSGGVDNLNQVADGEAQVSIAISSNCFQSYNGTDSFEGYRNEDLRVIAGLYFNPNQVVVTEASGIASLADVKGRHFAVAAAGSSVEGECRSHFAAAGLAYPDDIRCEYIAFGDAADMLQNGAIDGAWIMSGTPAAAVSQACSSGCRLLNLDEALIQRLQSQYPWYAPYTIPAGTYPGQDADVRTTAIKMVMFCSAELDEETVYQLTRTFWENIDELGAAQSSLRGLTAEAAVQDIAGLPLHDGAARYYKEAGVL